MSLSTPTLLLVGNHDGISEKYYVRSSPEARGDVEEPVKHINCIVVGPCQPCPPSYAQVYYNPNYKT